MSRDFARKFYHGKAWKATRAAYARSVDGLCERCLSAGRVVPGDIVHHKVHLTPSNISDPEVSLSFRNLELLCRDCHAAAHPEIYGRGGGPRPRFCFDADGNLVDLG